MSKRAAAAYEDGEMPKSKWTKRAMLAAIAECLDYNDLELTEEQASNLESMRKDDIFYLLFKWKSWHHTSKFCNETDFYGVNERTLTNAVSDGLEFRCVTSASISAVNGRKVYRDFTNYKAASEWLSAEGFNDLPLDGCAWGRTAPAWGEAMICIKKHLV